jgi:hypothetical protein
MASIGSTASRSSAFDLGTPRMDSLLARSKYAPIKGFADRAWGTSSSRIMGMRCISAASRSGL